MIRIPEHISIYKSMLEMAVCRGDVPSVKLALKYILLRDNAGAILKNSLDKIVLQQYSLCPPVYELTLDELKNEFIVWASEPSVDYRALSLAILYFKDTDFSIAQDFKIWEKSYRPSINISSFKQLILFKAAKYIEEVGFEDTKVLTHKILLDIPTATAINIDYFLGEYSWVRPHIDSFLKISAPNINAHDVLNVFETNRTTKEIQHMHYWDAAKTSLFEDPVKMESVWEMLIKPKVMDLITNLLTFRQPTEMSGLNL
jgi:hypothetical protein